jgi:predicted ArsR family transcriptional regulator
MSGTTATERMQDIERLFGEKKISFSVEQSSALPVLTAHTCTYPDLAEQDRTICEMEKTLFSNLLNQDVKLTACRLDGASCCTFEMS